MLHDSFMLHCNMSHVGQDPTRAYCEGEVRGWDHAPHEDLEVCTHVHHEISLENFKTSTQQLVQKTHTQDFSSRFQ